MTQEEKRLLLADLCARLPYGVRMKGVNEDFDLGTSTSPERLSYVLNSADFKPYLRPMSSMTEKEMFDFHENGGTLTYYFKYDIDLNSLTVPAIDWLNSYHFDYRGLIPMGLALEAPENMYNTK